MLTKLIEKIKSLFSTPTYQDSVEYYVISKQPKSSAEVEYWIQHYNQQQQKGWIV
jgi:hypothetical protein